MCPRPPSFTLFPYTTLFRSLPFEDASFDAATVGFGVRNVADLEAGLRELRRVLRAGGRLGILEITTPRGALAPFYKVDRKSTRLNSSHVESSYAVFCLKKKK